MWTLEYDQTRLFCIQRPHERIRRCNVSTDYESTITQGLQQQR